jgi:hypothetical protein
LVPVEKAELGLVMDFVLYLEAERVGDYRNPNE